MQVMTGTTATASAQASHARQPTFGALVSAIRRGDLDAANGAFDALKSLAPDTPGRRASGNLDAIGEALKTGDLEAARTALKDFQQAGANAAKEADDKPQQGHFRPGSSFNILV